MIKTGDIIFVRGESIFSPIIRWFDKGEYSHVCIAISDTHILEAQYFRKVSIRPFAYGDNEVEIIDLNLNEEQKRKVISVGLKLTGTWYDYPQLFWYVAKKWINLEGRNLFNNPNNLICSELIYHVLLACGYLTVDEKLHDLTPNELYLFLKNLCKQRANCKDIELSDYKLK